jgi:hypothetical protein
VGFDHAVAAFFTGLAPGQVAGVPVFNRASCTATVAGNAIEIVTAFVAFNETIAALITGLPCSCAVVEGCFDCFAVSTAAVTADLVSVVTDFACADVTIAANLAGLAWGDALCVDGDGVTVVLTTYAVFESTLVASLVRLLYSVAAIFTKLSRCRARITRFEVAIAIAAIQ